jgi:hypothetical protein
LEDKPRRTCPLEFTAIALKTVGSSESYEIIASALLF